MVVLYKFLWLLIMVQLTWKSWSFLWVLLTSEIQILLDMLSWIPCPAFTWAASRNPASFEKSSRLSSNILRFFLETFVCLNFWICVCAYLQYIFQDSRKKHEGRSVGWLLQWGATPGRERQLRASWGTGTVVSSDGLRRVVPIPQWSPHERGRVHPFLRN